MAEAARLRGQAAGAVVVDLDQYARIAKVAGAMNKHASYQQLREHLAYLKLAAVAEQLPAALEQAEKDKPGYTQFLHDLLEVEVQRPSSAASTAGCGSPGFPSTKTLEQFDFTAQPGIDRALVERARDAAVRRRRRPTSC